MIQGGRSQSWFRTNLPVIKQAGSLLSPLDTHPMHNQGYTCLADAAETKYRNLSNSQMCQDMCSSRSDVYSCDDDEFHANHADLKVKVGSSTDHLLQILRTC